MKKIMTEICKVYNIGQCISESQLCIGGLLHQTYQFETTTGKFIVKLLNPMIIDSVNCKKRYRTAENIAQELAKYIHAVSALTHQNDPLFTYGNATVMLFPYIDGAILSQHEVTTSHAEQIALSLAQIHQAKIINDQAPQVEIPDANSFITKASIPDEEIAKQFNLCLLAIEEIYTNSLRFGSCLKSNLIISHRDLDPKNVIWRNNQPYIIDWESAGLINQTKDLLVTALYWSIDEKFIVDQQRLLAFITKYQQTANYSLPHDEIAAGLYGLLSDWVTWLNFNLSRIINNPKQSDEFLIGTKEARNTLNAIPILLRQLPGIIRAIQ